MVPNIKAKVLQVAVKERDKYITKGEPSGKKGDELVQATAATVGFVSEIIHHRKEKKVRKDTAHTNEASCTESDGGLVPPQTCEEGASKSGTTSKDLAAAFLSRHPPLIRNSFRSSQRLETPILIPQRRPNTRARGFIPAYAPVLSSFDVSQNMFLDFVVSLNASLEPNPYLNAINLAGFAGEASPEPVVGLMVGLGVQIVTDVIMEAQSRDKSNGFLDRVNDGFFAPRGLFAFVVTWRPNEHENDHVMDVHIDASASTSRSQVDLVRTVKSVAAGDTIAKDAWRDMQQQLQRSILPAGGEVTAMTSAPLVWASADEITAVTPGHMAKKKDRFDRTGLWLDNHVDNHTQVTWMQDHPDHPLAGSLPKPEFRSRYADPSHAASSGDFVALLTGGQWHTKESEKKKEQEMKKEIKKRMRKEMKKEKKLKEKEEKLKDKEEKANVKQETPDAKHESSKQESPQIAAASDRAVDRTNGSSEGGTHETASCELSKRKSGERPRGLSEQRQEKANLSNGLSSLLKDNLVYLAIVQHL